eukprot:4328481-Pyramimonas_sp.AAC.1
MAKSTYSWVSAIAGRAWRQAGDLVGHVSGVGRTGFGGTWFSDVCWGAPPRPVPPTGTAVTPQKTLPWKTR